MRSILVGVTCPDRLDVQKRLVMKSFGLFLPVLLLIGLAVTVAAQVRISEFMASNTSTLLDEDGQYSDWIEIQNTSDTNVNMLNWALTDSPGNPGKWRFPATNLPPRDFLVIFASGKDRKISGKPLHTNFKLSADGEYLALVRPDNVAATQISPQFPAQFPNVSYGVAMQIGTTALVATNVLLRYLIPADPSVDGIWMRTNFDDSSWQTGTNGFGYQTDSSDPQEASFASKVLATQPVAYWRLDETSGPEAINSGTKGVEDEAGYIGGVGFGGAGPQPPQFPTFEPNNVAPVFDGASAYVNGPYELVNNLPAFTIAGWIYPTGTQNDRTGLFGQNDTIELGFISPASLQVWSPSGSVTVNYPFPDNQWHYVMAMGDNDQLSLYMDGSLAGSSSVSGGNFGESEYNFNIGGGGVFDPSGNYFKGQIDEVAVWFRALATNEIASLFDTNAGQISYTNYLNTDVRTRMYGSNSTAYVRIPFSVSDPSAFDTLKLLVRYDDGFVAYLNGRLIASQNAPVAPAWDSAATQTHPDSQAVQWQEYDLDSARSYLVPGNNVLAVQVLNISATNTDCLIQAQLLAQSIGTTIDTWRYFTAPSPGEPNGASPKDWGPVLRAAAQVPVVPQAADSLSVTAQIAQAFNPLSNVILHYRVMFNAEVSVPMNDSGTDGDALAGDGVWTGKIPTNTAAAGQLLRYYVTAQDTAGYTSRWPIFSDPSTSQQYLGTVIADPSIQSQLPVASLFIQNPSAADNQTGTRASLFYLNELYDNLTIYVHGQSSTGWPKKSHNLDFPKDHQFLYQPNGTRRGKVIFMSNYSDKARIRGTLTYEMIARSGGAGLFSFPIRIQLNGSFWGIEDMVEHGDEQFLERAGRDPSGALYKMYNNMSSASGNEKKTREWEGTADLTGFITSLDESIPLNTRVLYAYDNLDLPQTASYFADMALTSDQDHGHKNYYLCRDSDHTGEWTIFPWDVDLSWGRNWVDSFGGASYFNDVMFQTNVLNFYPGSPIQGKPSNRLYDLFFGASDFRQMYLRRLRTLMDTILMPPGTPANALVLEPLIRQSESNLNPPNISPSDAMLDYRAWGPTWGDTSLSQYPNDAERLISVHLSGRRDFLFNSPNATLNGDRIPPPQPTNAVVLIGSWDYNPVSGNQNEQYVELRNTNTYAVDVSNWRLIGGLEFNLRPGTVIPAGKSLYLAANVNAFRARTAAPHGGQGLFVQGPYNGLLSTQGNTPLLLENDQGLVISKNSYVGSSSSLPFVAGNLAVLRIGDATRTLSGQGNSVFIDQFATNGTLISTVDIPANGPNALISSGSASSEGALTLSADARLLVLAGYNVALTNTPFLSSSLASSSAGAAPRAVGVVDVAGNFALVAVITNQYSGNNVRCGTTDGRGNYWVAGATSGTFYFGSGSTNTVQSIVANTLVIQNLGDLFFSTAKATPGIWKIPGAPTIPSVPAVAVPTGSGSNPFAFTFSADFSTAYIADDTLTGKGGVQRWEYKGAAWTMSYAFAGLTNVGARGLAADFRGAQPVIYATTAEASGNRLVSITDTGPGSAVTTLATAGVNQVFRGVSRTPDNGIVPRFFDWAGTGSSFTLSWSALVNHNYTLQYTGDLGPHNWTTLTNLTAALPVMTFTDLTAPADTNRFYRLILNP